jgi:hypothetical protein
VYNSDTELLFPPSVIELLRDLRGEPWRELVDQVIQLEPTALDRLSFVLMMARLSGCASCEADSFRALRGCTQCASQSVRRHRGSDQDLLALMEKARSDVRVFLNESLLSV